ncbi:lipoprotein [Corallococcus sp. bb12-1]|uniref:lipoprotein n=1 Tax=Corallococcus sp. bb12-1 TaxID=2996784 RepID=UPI00226EAA32|nr:lipoprotein [Corallococcus sp. bb12-1]MCY1047073.1 lipoprotein [Corallococcus sp. bb12-1]
MRGPLLRLCVAAALTLGLVACGIKGSPHAPRPAPPPAPTLETVPPQEPPRGAVEPSGPTVPPSTTDAGPLP